LKRSLQADEANMSATHNRSIFVASLLVTGLAGCDVTVHDCTKEPDAKICLDDEEDEDAGDEPIDEDGSIDAGKSDGGTKSDGGADAGKNDGGTSADGGKDGSTDGATSADSSTAPITVDEFCTAQLRTAVAWRDALEVLCGGMTKDKQVRDDFLQRSLAYAADDAEGKCITSFNAPIMAGNTTFDGSKAMACADAFAGNFMAPPDPFPTAGIDLAMYEAMIAHGAPTLVQIPVCRAAFKGKLTRDKACSSPFECIEGLRCLPAPGSIKTCQPALTSGTCERTSDCTDGYTCVGSDAGGGRTCVKSDALTGGNCSLSVECATGYVCNSSNKCANPVASVICK
jgi:hypothetical protein